MKKIVLFILMMLPVAVMGQKDVTTFLGIPVDGKKTDFIQCLRKKGFILDYHSDNGILYGKFNGKDVFILIQTNNDKVCRVVISNKIETRNESDIIIEFNKLIDQFRNNKKYVEFFPNEKIEDSMDISYEISIKNKRYQAQFYQKPVELEPEDAEKISALQNKIKEAQLTNNTSVLLEILTELNTFYRKYMMNKLVWFMIHENFGKYSISIYYENGYNMANGEDL